DGSATFSKGQVSRKLSQPVNRELLPRHSRSAGFFGEGACSEHLAAIPRPEARAMNTEWTRPGPQGAVALLALLATIAAVPQASAQQGNDFFDQFVFQQHRTAAGARTRFNSELSKRLEEIDRDYQLTEAQKKKLQLAGRGDIQRFFDRYELGKEKFRLAKEG